MMRCALALLTPSSLHPYPLTALPFTDENTKKKVSRVSALARLCPVTTFPRIHTLLLLVGSQAADGGGMYIPNTNRGKYGIGD